MTMHLNHTTAFHSASAFVAVAMHYCFNGVFRLSRHQH